MAKLTGGLLTKLRRGKGKRDSLASAPIVENDDSSSNAYDVPKPTLAEQFAQQPYSRQESSPLFTLLPAELRNRIFFYALLEDNNPDKMIPFDSYGYRPEHTHKHRHAVEVLRTCKIAYLEARLIPAKTATHVIWYCSNERAPHGEATSPAFDQMTDEQLKAVSRLHIYAQQEPLEKPGWARCFSNPREIIQISHLTITVRHTDCWWWEYDRPLRFDGDSDGEYGMYWRQEFARAFPALETLQMELETLDRRRAEMDSVVHQVRQWRIELGEGRVLSTEGEKLDTRIWQGTSSFCGGVPAPEGASTLPYYVVTVSWKVINA